MADPKIRIKRSSVPGKIPTDAQVPLGELALNTYDGKLFASKDIGAGTTVYAVNPWTAGVGTDTYDTYFTAGNVGVGTTVPTSALHIVGDALVTGIVTATGGFNLGISSGGTSISSGPITTLNILGAGNTVSVDGTTANITLTGVAFTQTPGRTVTSYTTTAGVSTYSVTYSVGYLDAYLNGSRLHSSEFTATDGSSVILTDGPSEGDVLDLIYYTLGIGDTGPQGATALTPWVTTEVGIHTLSSVGIGTTNPAYQLDVGGDINSSTDVKIGGVSVLTTASNDAVALAIALG
jgi:hypothetical protein